VDEEFYFMSLAGLGVSLAGFAGLISALDRRPVAHSAVAAWRIRNIVLGGFTITFAGFATVLLFNLTNKDMTLTVRLASLILAAANVVPMFSEARPGPAWPTERGRLVAIAATLLIIAADLGNVIVGGLGYLQLLFLVQLSGPVSIFINTVREVAGGDRSDPQG
jgi:hypothetical protein